MQAHIGITENSTTEVTQVLSNVLADEFFLYTKTRNAHWNVEGIDFYEKHMFFELQYRELDRMADSVAERIRTIGHYAPASIRAYSKLTRLSESSREKNDSAGFIRELLADHESIVMYLRESMEYLSTDNSDPGSTEFITGLIKNHERMAWMLRAHLG